MKILITIYDINNPGGIVNHIENLIAGFLELGHEVNFVQLLWKDRAIKRTTRFPERFTYNQLGMLYHQKAGWIFPAENRIAYKGKYNLQRWKNFAEQYDLIIWEVPVPTKQQQNRGNLDWLEVYNLSPSVKQIGIVHDGNLRRSYPWISYVKEHFNGLACVHPCAYHGADVVEIPRALILNPQDLSEVSPLSGWQHRSRGFLSLQTFKGWKHVDDLIRAIAHMDEDIEKYVAGGGIEYRYMTSKEKCKEKYFVSRKLDPDISENLIGQKIWDVALYKGMDWLGYIHPEEVDRRMKQLRCVIDPSWSKNYAKIGDHFNRVIVDGIMRGLVPIARNLGVSTNLEGEGEIFKPNKHYVMVPFDATPKEFGSIVEDTINLSSYQAQEYHYNNLELLPLFQRTKIAQEYIDLGNSLPTGFYNKLETGVSSTPIEMKATKIVKEFFGEGKEHGSY